MSSFRLIFVYKRTKKLAAYEALVKPTTQKYASTYIDWSWDVLRANNVKNLCFLFVRYFLYPDKFADLRQYTKKWRYIENFFFFAWDIAE